MRDCDKKSDINKEKNKKSKELAPKIQQRRLWAITLRKQYLKDYMLLHILGASVLFTPTVKQLRQSWSKEMKIFTVIYSKYLVL